MRLFNALMYRSFWFLFILLVFLSLYAPLPTYGAENAFTCGIVDTTQGGANGESLSVQVRILASGPDATGYDDDVRNVINWGDGSTPTDVWVKQSNNSTQYFTYNHTYITPPAGNYSINFSATATNILGNPETCTEAGGPFTVTAPPTGTVCYTSNITTTVNITGPSNFSHTGTSGCATGVPIGTYNASGSPQSCFAGPTYNANPQTLTNGGTITFALSYTSTCGGGGPTPPPQVCGNGVIEGSEQCDNGVNNGPSGTCSTSCTVNSPTQYGTVGVRSFCNGIETPATMTVSYLLPSGATGQYGVTTPTDLGNAGPGWYWAGWVSGMPAGCNTFVNITPGWNAGYSASGQYLNAGSYIVFNYNFISPAPTLSLSCSPNPIAYNSAGTLSWSSTNVSANSCSITPASKVSGSSTGLPASGSKSTTALTAPVSYSINCTGTNGTPISKPATCNVSDPIYGCTNPAATNYNSSAQIDNGTCTYACQGPDTQSCTSSTNACGQTSTGTQTRTCINTSVNPALWSLWGTCSATTPANPAGYGSACTGATSAPNACGQTSPGGAGTIQCNGSCSGTAGTTPANPAGYGNACTSAPNACGQTASGTIQCDGTCSAVTPPNTCSSTASLSASPNPIIYGTASTLTWSSTNTVANSCSIPGLVSNGATSGSVSTGNLTTTTSYTVTCTGFNGSPVSASTTVTVGAAPAMGYFRCNGVNTNGTCTIGYGGTAGLSWSSSNTTGCSLVAKKASDGSVISDDYVAGSGSRNDTGITADRNYEIECWNGTSGVHAPALPLPLRAVVSAPSVDLDANSSDGPITLAWNSSATLSWSSTNAGSCTASGDWSGNKATSGSQSTGNLAIPKTYTYTLACSGNGSASDSVNIIISPPVPNSPSPVTAAAPDYCMSGPAVTVSWNHSDPSGSPQYAYEVEIDDQGSFNSPEVDTGKIISNSGSYFTGQGILQFNKTYKIRVRTWNTYDVVSSWAEMSGNFNTPQYAYPQVNFTWTSNSVNENPSPPLGKPVQFTDQTVFNGNPNGRRWNWNFGDSTSSTTQNPTKTYNSEGTYYVTLTATDNANQTCSRTRGPLIIQKPIPKWREVAPK